jgi:hypothetical protein
MTGKTVLIFFGILVSALYGAGFFFHLDYMKFWPRITLGIAGLLFMIIMHIYSIRKKSRNFFFFKWFNYKLSTYLNIHIILATLGVGLIIVHAIGSYNSIIAWVSFFSMLMVWQSGFIGRYIFVKIPKDNSGLIAERNEILEKLEQLNTEFIKSMKENHEDNAFQEFLLEYLSTYAKSLHLLHKRSEYTIVRFYKNFKQIVQAFKLYKSNLIQLKKKGHEWAGKSDKKNIDLFEAHLKTYEEKMKEILLVQFQIEFLDMLKSLFKNWHDVHVPLTYLLYTTAVLHVIVIVLFSSFAK